ncbi:hypothetical protein CDW43_06805 [Methylophaga nitratireducenticrescens]|nr:hypothetical protein CDW43_06805 [Methylophaga nitratireducenticrescens]
MYLTPLGLTLKNSPSVFVVILNKRRAKLPHPAHAPDLHPCRPRRVALFQSQPEGLGLFFRPTSLKMIYVEQLHQIINAL